jgi:hypothetical protein
MEMSDPELHQLSARRMPSGPHAAIESGGLAARSGENRLALALGGVLA